MDTVVFRFESGEGEILKRGLTSRYKGEFTAELETFLEKNEICITGDQLRERFKVTYLKDFERQRTLEALFAMLVEQANIPKKWRQYMLLFPGAIMEEYKGTKFMPCLKFTKEKWVVDVCSLSSDFYQNPPVNSRVVHARDKK